MSKANDRTRVYTEPYLNDGSGCTNCNFSGRFGFWLDGKWSCYPQISCSHCTPSKARQTEEARS